MVKILDAFQTPVASLDTTVVECVIVANLTKISQNAAFHKLLVIHTSSQYDLQIYDVFR